MNDQSKTKRDLIQELVTLRKRIEELNQYESDRKQAEFQREAALEALRESEYKYKSLIENIPDIIFTIDLEGRITFVSKRAKEILGYENSEAINKNILSFIPEEAHQSIIEKIQKGMSGEKIKHVQLPVTAKSGENLFFDFSFSRIYKDGVVVGAQGTGVDITERKQAEEALRESEEKYSTILESFQEGYFEVDLKGNFTFCNDAMFKITEYSKEELMGKNFSVYTDEENAKKVYQAFHKVYTTGEPSKGLDWPYIKKDGTQKYIESSIILIKDSSGKPTGFKGMVRDITDRKKVEKKIEENERQYRLLTEKMSDIVWIADMNLKEIYVSPSVKNILGFSQEERLRMPLNQHLTPHSLSLVSDVLSRELALEQQGNADPNRTKKIELEYYHKNGSTRWMELNISGLRDDRGVLTGIHGVSRDITERKLAEEKLRQEEQRFRVLAEQSSDIILLINREQVIIYENPAVERILGLKRQERIGKNVMENLHPDDIHVVLQAFNALIEDKNARSQTGEIRIRHVDGNWRTFEVVASNLTNENIVEAMIINLRDITERKQAEEKLQLTLNSLRKAVGTTVQVLVSALESRDPYTAGHQSRSANLACAIAMEIGLAPEKIEGIRMAGIIHDIGKLSIPAEILSKPSKLTNIEFSLIKEHSRRGYEMLKDVESPWPLAEIVYQHHERINGSGYPRNLKGDDIIMESRILAVADVVEAMASHRPYRAALGIEAALEEIEKNKGILYDNYVAAACLKLFREKAYQLT